MCPVDLWSYAVLCVIVLFLIFLTTGVKCFGDGDLGRLGSQNTTNIGDLPGYAPPPDVSVGGTVVAITASYFATCAILSTNALKCWGSQFAYLGVGTSFGSIGSSSSFMGTAMPQVNLGSQRYARQVLGMSDSFAVLLDDANVKAWGYNGDGRLGLGHTFSRGGRTDASDMGDALLAVDFGTATLEPTSAPTSSPTPEPTHSPTFEPTVVTTSASTMTSMTIATNASSLFGSSIAVIASGRNQSSTAHSPSDVEFPVWLVVIVVIILMCCISSILVAIWRRSSRIIDARRRSSGVQLPMTTSRRHSISQRRSTSRAHLHSPSEPLYSSVARHSNSYYSPSPPYQTLLKSPIVHHQYDHSPVLRAGAQPDRGILRRDGDGELTLESNAVADGMRGIANRI